MATKWLEVTDLSRDERDVARRWCIFNRWGWPPDLSMPATNAERYRVSVEQMAKAERAIGRAKCLAYWNSDEFRAMDIPQVFTSEPKATGVCPLCGRGGRSGEPE